MFRRADGSLIPYSIHSVATGTGERRIDLEIEEGIVVVSHPNNRFGTETYVIEPSLVPRTRSVRFEHQFQADWLHVDSDAVALLVEQQDRPPEVRFKTELVLFSESAARVTALYADGRAEVIFDYFSCGVGNETPASIVAESEPINARWLHALMVLAALFCCITFGRRIATARAD